jgi:hypothetical protein
MKGTAMMGGNTTTWMSIMTNAHERGEEADKSMTRHLMMMMRLAITRMERR